MGEENAFLLYANRYDTPIYEFEYTGFPSNELIGKLDILTKMNKQHHIINYVKSEQLNGCTIACIAMILNKTYWEIAEHFSTDFDKSGISIEQIMDYLHSFNLTIFRKSVYSYSHPLQFKSELLTPFADIHMIRCEQFIDGKFGHVFVMDKDGHFYDPNVEMRKEVNDMFYISDCIGIYYNK